MKGPLLPCPSSVLGVFVLATSTQETSLDSGRPWSKPQEDTSE
jgi:hypothetical protein